MWGKRITFRDLFSVLLTDAVTGGLTGGQAAVILLVRHDLASARRLDDEQSFLADGRADGAPETLVSEGARQTARGRAMEQVHHGSATTTHAVKAAIQRSQAAPAQLSRELGINHKTVAKWRRRATVEGMKTGPKEPRSTVLTWEDEATAFPEIEDQTIARMLGGHQGHHVLPGRGIAPSGQGWLGRARQFQGDVRSVVEIFLGTRLPA